MHAKPLPAEPCCTGNCQQGRRCPLRRRQESPTATFMVGMLFGAVAVMLLAALSAK